jgi:PAS domain S-box-containing protein
VKPLPLQLDIALQTGQVIPWEFDPSTGELTWHEPSINGPIHRIESFSEWVERVHPEDRAFVCESLEQALKNGFLDIQYRRFSGTGNLHRIRARARAEGEGGNSKIAGITIDLTERHRATLQLHTQQAVTKVLEDWTDLRSVSARLLQVLCETQEWEIGNLWQRDRESDRLVLFESWAPPHMQAAAETVSAKHTFSIGEGLPGRVWVSGQPVWIADVSKDTSSPRFPAAQGRGISGAFAFPIYLGAEFFGVMEFFSIHVRKEDHEVAAMLSAVGSQVGQVIERRRAERELRESEERHRTIAETASDAILTIDETGNIIFANPAVEHVFGYLPQELIGERLTVLMPERLRDEHRASLSRYLLTETRHIPWKGVEMPGRHKNGTELNLELSFGEFQKNGKRFLTGVARDVSSRKKAEDALKSSEKLAATGRLAASMAHEINNPLTSVTNILYLLNLDPELAQANRRLVQTAQQEIQRVSHIVKQTLGFYRESNEPVETDVAEIVDGVLELFANQLRGRSIDVNREYRTSRRVKNLPGELRQVVSNLVENAIQAAQDHGSIAVRLANATETCNSRRPGVRLTICDTGSGIRPENQKRVFEPFFTTKGERGTGLGLWVTRGIVEKHGGKIRLRSSVKPGASGTCFSVFLPMVSDVASSKAA